MSKNDTLENLLRVYRENPQQFKTAYAYPVLIRDASPVPAEAAGFHTLTGGVTAPFPGSKTIASVAVVPFVFVVEKRGKDALGAKKISIGRASNADISVINPTVSKFHAYFEQSGPDAYVLVDVHSRNGTIVNGARLAPDTPTVVPSNAVVTLGQYELRFMMPADFHQWVAARAG